MPLTTQDWIPTTFAGASFQFYVERIDAALQQLYDQYGRVAVVGHSAGGWVPRIVLGDQPYEGGRLELLCVALNCVQHDGGEGLSTGLGLSVGR